MDLDYKTELNRSAETGEWQTAKVPPEKFEWLTHRLRYQAGRLGLVIEIHTDRQDETVSFLCKARL
jgi:hypothetical protein